MVLVRFRFRFRIRVRVRVRVEVRVERPGDAWLGLEVRGYGSGSG